MPSEGGARRAVAPIGTRPACVCAPDRYARAERCSRAFPPEATGDFPLAPTRRRVRARHLVRSSPARVSRDARCEMRDASAPVCVRICKTLTRPSSAPGRFSRSGTAFYVRIFPFYFFKGHALFFKSDFRLVARLFKVFSPPFYTRHSNARTCIVQYI